jgi:hypothetical protein
MTAWWAASLISTVSTIQFSETCAVRAGKQKGRLCCHFSRFFPGAFRSLQRDVGLWGGFGAPVSGRKKADSVAKEGCAKISLLHGDARDESQGAAGKTRLVQSSRLALTQKSNECGAASKRCASAENQGNESYPIFTRPTPVIAPHQFPNFPPKGNRKAETKYDSDRHPGGFD